MKKTVFFFSLWIMALSPAFSQQSLRVMSYNLMNYGNYYGGCTTSNNHVNDKKEYIKTIVNYVQPDIFAALEMDSDPYFSEHLLGNALNVDGVTKWKMGNPPNVSGAYTVNQIFYNSERLQLLNSIGVQTNFRDINLYRFKVLDAGTADDLILNCFVVHLKAGQDYAGERKNEVQTAMNYIENFDLDGNNLFMGDFNFYGSNEAGYQLLLNYPAAELRFYDPLNLAGEWHNNYYFKSTHTQSTHVVEGCAAGGGMDDRFDFILVSDEILNGTGHITYVDGSYSVTGQDGQHFNQAINAGSNNSVPSDVLEALYQNSDHLPVVLDLEYDNNGIRERKMLKTITVQNPVRDHLQIFISRPLEENLFYRLVDVTGRTLFSGTVGKFAAGKVRPEGDTGFEPGIYFLEISMNGESKTFKLCVRK